MIFLTVGTQFAFDRLVTIIDEAIEEGYITEQVLGQIGPSSYKPRNFQHAQFFEKPVFDKLLKQSSAIIAHAGMGSIIMAMENNKPLLAMPRLKKYGEVINDHQLALARKFDESGHILVAYTGYQLPEKIRQLRTFVPEKRQANPQAISESITKFLETIKV